MRFIRFTLGGLLTVGAIVLLFFMFTFGIAFAGMGGGHSLLNWLIAVVIILVAFFGGIWLMRKNRP